MSWIGDIPPALLDDLLTDGVMFVLGVCGASFCWIGYHTKKMESAFAQWRVDLQELRAQSEERSRVFNTLVVDMAKVLAEKCSDRCSDR